MISKSNTKAVNMKKRVKFTNKIKNEINLRRASNPPVINDSYVINLNNHKKQEEKYRKSYINIKNENI